MHLRLLVPALFSALVLVACGQNPEPPPPVPDSEEQDRIGMEADTAGQAARDAERQAAEEEAARLAAEEAAERARATLQEEVYFGYDEFDIDEDAEQSLRAKAEILQANPEVRLRITGHTDERGSGEYNLALGMRRATAVRNFLTAYGLDGARFTVASFGEERPADSGTSEAAYSRNRRAEFSITAGGDQLRASGR